MERKRALSKRVEELTLDLVRIRSIVGTTDENQISDAIYALFNQMPYWQAHPDKLKQLPFINDPLGRSSVMVEMTGELRPNAKTVILIGHTDTVGISDYGDFKELATEPGARKEV